VYKIVYKIVYLLVVDSKSVYTYWYNWNSNKVRFLS